MSFTEKLRRTLLGQSKAGQGGAKKWVAIVIFGAIIVVFALFGINPDKYGQTNGGVAATVNHEAISISEFRQEVENRERNLRMQFGDLPEQQRKAASDRIRAEALDTLIQKEIYYQQAQAMGIVIPDAKVQETILSYPILQDNGRFKRERYDMFLQQYGMTPRSFEQSIRKDMMIQTMQNLFIGASTPTQEEIRRNRMLANQKVNLRFAEISKDELANPAFVSGGDVEKFLAKNKDQVEKYYNDNKVEFTHEASVKTRHILMRPNEKRDDAATAKAIADVAKQATASNFAILAAQHSEDPGSKAKGGELPEFSNNGSMIKEFADAAFGAPVGKVTGPVKTQYGYHLILVEKKQDAKTETLAEAQTKIARKLIARQKETEIAGELRKMVEKGNKGEVESMVSKAGAKWQDTGEFDLSSSFIPKLGANPNVIGAIVKKGKGGGILPELISNPGGGFVVAEVTSWKEGAANSPEVEGMDKMVAYRKANELINGWSNDLRTRVSVIKNYRLVPQEQQGPPSATE